MRQAIWLPPGFVLGSLAELGAPPSPGGTAQAAGAGAPAPAQLEPPAQEVDEAGRAARGRPDARLG